MTEKMINGIDVSGCGFLDNHRPTKLLLCNECNSDFAAMECKDYTDCYYKQLKRLEADYKKLKEDVKEAQEAYQFKRIHCEVYKADNMKLRKALEEIKSIIDNDFINRYMELSFNEYDDILEQIEKICEVLKDE